MKSFHYEGLSPNGAQVEGIIEAFDKAEAVVKAREYCRVLLKVDPVSTGKVDDVLHADIGVLLSGGKIKPKKLALLCSQLSIELKAGLPLVKSLKLVAENEEDKYLKGILLNVADDVMAGHSLARAFETRAPKLPTTFIETVRAGEASGNLDESFSRLQKYYEDSAAIAAKVGSAMIYPILLILVAIAVVAIIMIKAVPVFEESFASMGNTLPGPTRALIGISHFFTDNLLLLIAIVIVLVLGFIVFRKTEVGKHFFARLALKFPGIGLVNRMSASAQLCSTLSTMLASGIALVQATQITATTMSNVLLNEEITEACNGLIEGKTLSNGLSKSEYLPNLLTEMITVGEETGNMEETLTVVAEYYNKEVDVAVKRALGIMEPVITLFLAGIVVFILLAVYLPIFSLYGSM